MIDGEEVEPFSHHFDGYARYAEGYRDGYKIGHRAGRRTNSTIVRLIKYIKGVMKL